MVGLKLEKPTKQKPGIECSNSTMVGLKLDSKLEIVYVNPSSNSTMVGLKPQQTNPIVKELFKFKFHYGRIKTSIIGL